MQRYLAIVLGIALAIAGCIRTERVYVYPDGSESHVRRDAKGLELKLARLAPGQTAYSFQGVWTGFGEWSSAGAKPGPTPRLAFSDATLAGQMTSCSYLQHHEVAGLPLQHEGPVAFAFRNDAGMLSFTGDVKDLNGQGEVTFQPNAAYLRQLADAGAKLDTPADVIDLFLDPITPAYLSEMKQELGSLSFADARRLHRAGVEKVYVAAVKAEGYSPRADQLVEMAQNKVSIDDMQRLKAAGYQMTIADLVSMRRYGIKADYAIELRSAGLKASPADVFELNRYGIRPSYVKGMYEAGYSFDQPQIRELNRYGIRPEFAKAWKDAGYQFGVEELKEASRYGLSAAYAKKLHEAGYSFDLKNLIELNRYGIRAEYASAARSAGYKLSVADLIELNRYGISSDFLAALHEEGKPNYAVADIIEFNRRGLSADTIRRIRAK